MNPEEKELLQKVAKISEENYRMLRSLRASAHWDRFFELLKWALIIIPLVLGYFYFQPYLKTISSAYGQLQDIQGQLPSINNLLDQLPKLPAR